MSPLDDIPEPWRQAMEKAGVPSLNQLAAKTGAGVSTLSDLVYGRRHASERTVRLVAEALRAKVTTIREWADAARGEEKPYEPPAEANRLNRRQRRAVDELIRAIVARADDEEASAPRPGGGKLVDLARPPQPDLSRVAARRGESEGKRRRREQDDDAHQ